MKKEERILVALGLGTYCQGVFDFAVRVAQGLDAHITVANIINDREIEAVRTVTDMGYNVDGDHYVSEAEAKRRALLEKIMEGSSFPREKISVIMRVGNPIDQLLKIINEDKIDIIIMGPKGRTDLERVLLGSVAEKVFRKSPVTVISYRDRDFAERLRKRGMA